MATRVNFDRELIKLKQSLLEMSDQIEHAYGKLLKGLRRRDKELLQQIREEDHIIDDMQRAIESRCLTLLIKQTPVARDMRVVSASLKMVTDLERSGHHAADIAEIFLRMSQSDLDEYSREIDDMITKVVMMHKSAVTSFVERNEDLANQTIAYDDEIDGCFNSIKNDIIAKIHSGAANPDGCVDALLIAKWLEKVGDHAVNICEWENFQETGTIGEHRIM
ncbi:MAG: phosphate signaling complex protein PhoU [Lachnospiraceae bacterium]|nr:phosphate signaling complex protein PhoU [Lachnospiraceae bacterium]